LKYETGLSSGDGTVTLAQPDARSEASRLTLASPDRTLISRCPVEAALR